jgi:AcrR family transcriptional regulator
MSTPTDDPPTRGSGAAGPARRIGRRPGDSGTRELIAAAARRQFGERGYDRATMRSIASEAGVDPGLVIHFFGTKWHLFLEVVTVPVDPERLIASIIGAPAEERGARLARAVVTLLRDAAYGSAFTAMLRAAVSEPLVANVLRERLTENVFLPVAVGLGIDRARLRAELAVTQTMGLVLGRHVLGMEALVAASDDDLVSLVGPALQWYLSTGT